MKSPGYDGVRDILQHYDLHVDKIKVVEDKGRKTIWSVRTPAGEPILKKLPRPPAHVAFITAATRYLKTRGVAVADVIPTRDGGNFVESGGDCFVLFEAVRGQKAKFKSKRQLAVLVESLGRFHKGSQGFRVPEGIPVRSLLGTWPAAYQERLQELLHLKDLAGGRSDRFSRIFLNHVDRFIDRGYMVLDLLMKSAYGAWVEQAREAGWLCHQDYTPSNLRIGDNDEVCVYDMDSVIHDLPARDLRKLFNKCMKQLMQKGGWRHTRAREILDWYHAAHPLAFEEWRVVVLDIMFPHLFCEHASKYYHNRGDPHWDKAVFLKRLEHLSAVEFAKERALKEHPGSLKTMVP